MRAEFMATWVRQLRKLNSLVPALHIKEILSLLDLANRWKIWEYAHIELGDIPYVLIVLADFSPSNARLETDRRSKRNFYLRFFDDSSLRDIEDMWIRPGTKPALHRVSYVPTARGGPPPAKNIKRSFELEIDATFSTDLAPIHPFPFWVTRAMQEWFQANWQDLNEYSGLADKLFQK